MRIAVLAPIKTSLYSRLVTHLAALETGIRVTDIIVRTPWTIKRIRDEMRRDGLRLINKAYEKMILGAGAYDEDNEETLPALARRVHLPGDTLKDLAQIHGIPLTVTKDHNNTISQRILKKGGIDIIAFTGGGLIRKPVLDIPRLGVLNCHMGLLPAYRGMDVVEWPFLDHAEVEPQVGLTLHFMDEGVDTGPILIRQTLELRQGDTFASIRSRMESLMVQLVLEGLRGLRDRCMKPQLQKKDAGRQYYLMHPRILKQAERKLQWNSHP